MTDGGEPSIARRLRDLGLDASASTRAGPTCRGAADSAKTSLGRAVLDRAPRVHDHHRLRRLGDDAEVVRDEDDADVEVALDLVDQLEDLGLHGHVERGRRLVGDQHVGLCTSAIAIIARWRMPPENWCG